MSHDKTLDTLCRLAEADRVAKTFEHVDINSTVQQCPASQSQIFVIPVRYSLSEEPASHPASQPGVEPQSHPMAARLLRTGFVYVWQGRGPLQRYAMALNKLLRTQELDDDDTIVQVGSLSGVALDKHQEAWMLYSEIPLNPASYQQLSEPEHRTKRMRRLDLRQVANTLQAPHCPPLKDASQVMAELRPDTYDRAVAIDCQQNGAAYQKAEQQLAQQVFAETNPRSRQINIKAYIDAKRWNTERCAVVARNPGIKADSPPAGEWSAEPWAPFRTTEVLELAHNQAQGLYTVFACLDDDLGVLRDINHEQELVESRHEQWQADNNLRLSIGGFVRSLITEDGAEVAGNLSYRYRDHDIELTPEQGKTLLEAHHRMDGLFREETRINQQRGAQYGHKEADALLRNVHADVQAAVAPVRGFIPVELHTEVESVIREYRAEKISNLENDHASAKVEQYIDLSRMNQWLDHTAPAHFTNLQQRHEVLYADRGAYLFRHQSGTWHVDYSDSEHREWLDKLAMACLSGQCLRKQGAEQYADYVRSADEGALRQLFYGWSPTLEAAVNSTSRAGELIASLGLENQVHAEQAIGKVLGAMGLPTINQLGQQAKAPEGNWNILIKRLGAALLLLKGEHGTAPGGPWLGILVAARLGNSTGLRAITEGGQRVWQLFGRAAEDLTRWVNTTGKAIGAGATTKIVNSPAINNAGGLVAVAALLLNSWNAGSYLRQVDVLEGMDSQRVNDTMSATLYAGAALVAVIHSQVSTTAQFKFGVSAVPMFTLFGGVVGGLSALAAFKEFKSLQVQLENSQVSTDPWLQIRKAVVGGQTIAFGAQAVNGLAYTYRAIAGSLTVRGAALGYALWMGPLHYLIAVLGVLYLIAWYFQQSPMQMFLNDCCWSKVRARDLMPISFGDQQKELGRLYDILYIPRVSFETAEPSSVMTALQSGEVSRPIKKLIIDLPGAEPNNVFLDIAMVGNPMDSLAWRERVKNGQGSALHEERLQDIGDCWIHYSSCEWIPYTEGQGLRLSGPFNTVPNLFSSLPTKVSVRLRYRTALTAILGTHSYIGGERGVAFTLTESSGVVALRNDPTPELDRAPRRSLGDLQCSIFLQPKAKR